MPCRNKDHVEKKDHGIPDSLPVTVVQVEKNYEIERQKTIKDGLEPAATCGYDKVNCLLPCQQATIYQVHCFGWLHPINEKLAFI
jgi:ribosomal protein L3